MKDLHVVGYVMQSAACVLGQALAGLDRVEDCIDMLEQISDADFLWSCLQVFGYAVEIVIGHAEPSVFACLGSDSHYLVPLGSLLHEKLQSFLMGHPFRFGQPFPTSS